MIDLMIGTFILDFQSVDFEPDGKIAVEMLSEMQKACQLENAFALDPPVQSAGWSFAKMYAAHSYEVEALKGKRFEDKFVAWLQKELKNRGCGAQIKMAPEMKSL